MLKDKWDYIFIEHLDDIVVGKGKMVRFVQVKSSEKVKMKATDSPASGLYLRSPIAGGQKEKITVGLINWYLRRNYFSK